MTGPEHYLHAQELAARAASAMDNGSKVALAAIAQVHATLALAAATALSGPDAPGWRGAAGPSAPRIVVVEE